MGILAYASDTQAATTRGGAIPYVVVSLCAFFVILYYVFAPDGVVTGSVVYMFFGSYFSLLVLCGLMFWALYYYLPQITDAHNFTLFNWTSHDTGVYTAGAFTVLAFLLLVSRLRRAKARKRRRGFME